MKTTTIQETAKRLKAHILTATLTLVVGLIWLVYEIAITTKGSDISIIPILFIVIGGFWYIATKFRIWWHHK